MYRNIRQYLPLTIIFILCLSSQNGNGAACFEGCPGRSGVFSANKNMVRTKSSNGYFAKKWGKVRRFLQKNRQSVGQDTQEKKKLSFGGKALLFLGGGLVGLLIGTGIGNFMVFTGWLLALIFGLRGLKHDKNKFPAVIALMLAGLSFLSTITFLEVGIF